MKGEDINRASHDHCHYIIDGEPVQTIAAVCRRLRDLGCEISESGVKNRLQRGVNTWADLAKPSQGRAQHCKTRAEQRAESKAECVEAMARVDQRKRELAEQQRQREKDES